MIFHDVTKHSTYHCDNHRRYEARPCYFFLHTIREAKKIDKKVLLNPSFLPDFSVAQRMSWAATRETTRVEDKAYCLLGLFGIKMPMRYGEGVRAFERLQLEIIQTIHGHSILA